MKKISIKLKDGRCVVFEECKGNKIRVLMYSESDDLIDSVVCTAELLADMALYGQT